MERMQQLQIAPHQIESGHTISRRTFTKLASASHNPAASGNSRSRTSACLRILAKKLRYRGFFSSLYDSKKQIILGA